MNRTIKGQILIAGGIFGEQFYLAFPDPLKAPTEWEKLSSPMNTIDGLVGTLEASGWQRSSKPTDTFQEFERVLS